MDPQDRQDAKAGIRDVRIRGSRLLLRALQSGEIEEEWRAMVTADPMVIAELPQEAGFKARLQRSGHLEDGWLDLAIDLDGVSIGRIQTFVPPGRALPPGTFDVGIDLRENARNKSMISFAVSLSVTIIGIGYLHDSRWIRGFLALGLLYMVTSSFTLPMHPRPPGGNRPVSRVDQARLDKLLAEQDLLRVQDQ